YPSPSGCRQSFLSSPPLVASARRKQDVDVVAGSRGSREGNAQHSDRLITRRSTRHGDDASGGVIGEACTLGNSSPRDCARNAEHTHVRDDLTGGDACGVDVLLEDAERRGGVRSRGSANSGLLARTRDSDLAELDRGRTLDLVALVEDVVRSNTHEVSLPP